MEITCRLEAFGNYNEGTRQNGEPWRKQEIVVNYQSGNYTNKLAVVCFDDMADTALAMQQGVDYRIAFDIQSREFNGRWYTDVKAWKIEQAQPKPAPQPAQPTITAQRPPLRPQPQRAAQPQQQFDPQPQFDDLPF